jgi:predicted acylesterase/phospholipase RssA
MERRNFLLALGAAGVTPALIASTPPDEGFEPLGGALVLSGGGALGAYEAGIVNALAAWRGIGDGAPLAPYELVCGTSIGALNGWFVATGQYSKLRDLWYGASGQSIVRPKTQFAAVRDPESGLLNRAASAVSLIGLTKDQKGLLQSEPVFDWIARHIDPNTPLVMPFVWATTNLTLQRPEYFYLRPPGKSTELPQRVERALKLSLGPHTIVREATPDLLHRAIFASAALPLAFDPVLIPDPEGVVNAYCDGGVASNSPVGIAHAISRAADVVLLDPPFQPDTDYKDALEIGYGVFGTMQRKILEVEMRNAYFQSMGKRAFARLTGTELARSTGGMQLVAKYMQSITETDLRYIRPEKALPLSVIGFDDEVGIGQAYRIGWEDAVNRGFSTYDWQTFQL